MSRAILVLIVICLAGGCMDRAKSEKQPPQSTSAAPGDSPAAPADSSVTLKILDFEGLERLIASHRGKVVVMDAWSTWCEPCVKEFPHLVELHRQYGPQRVACISLSFDYDGVGRPEEKRETVLGFLRKQGATFDNVLSSIDSDALAKKLGIASVPAIFVYARDGSLAKRFDNERPGQPPFTYAQVKQKVEELLASQ